MQDMNRANKHCVAESTALSATNWGEHIFSVRVQADCDNGTICARGEYVGDEVYKADTYAAGKQALLILNPPTMEFDNLPSYAMETAYYNAKGEDVRAYALKKGDRFTVSDVIFDGAPAEGKYVTFVGGKYKVAASADATQFCAQIVKKITQRNITKYKLLVESL